jgi:signal transduction histidine kinase
VGTVTSPSDPPDAQARERARLAALHALRILDTPDEERFDRITRVAAQACGVPMALITLIDTDRQWAKSCLGPIDREIPRTDSFCVHDLDLPAPLVVSDARQDERFAGNPLVTGAPHLRFYAGVTFRSADGHALGRLCVLDAAPRTPDPACLRALQDLVAWVELELHTGAAPASREDAEVDALARMQERFLTVAAHELRTPLTLIRGFSDELLDSASGPLSREQHESAAAIARGAERLQALVDDLMLVLELDAGRVALTSAPLDLATLVAQLCERFGDRAAAAGVTLATQVAPGAAVAADAERLGRALGALLRNAIDWSPRGGTVRIAASADGVDARVSISDEGPGMPEGEYSRLGRRFRRLRGTDPREGAGLGLVIARAIAELHGGRLAAEPAAGGGACLHLTLPARAAEAGAAAAGAARQA